MSESERPPLRVSDHALLRYMERVKGIRVDEYRDELLALAVAHDNTPRPTNAAAGQYFTIVIGLSDNVVATVLGQGQKRKNRRFGSRMIYVPAGSL